MAEIKVLCRLKELMDKKGISQLELSEKTGLAPTTIGRLYRNQASRFDVSTLEKLAGYFQLTTITELLEFKKV
jgi:transcriptional regulator with XRE-family HTH domain